MSIYHFEPHLPQCITEKLPELESDKDEEEAPPKTPEAIPEHQLVDECPEQFTQG